MERDETLLHGSSAVGPRSGAQDSEVSAAEDTVHDRGEAENEWDLPVGAELGRYVLLDRIGAGAMGLVYSAYDAQLDRKIAIKIMKIDRGRREPSQSAAARLQREAQALARLSHPNVVPIYDVGMLDDRVWVALELVQGWTVRQWLDRRPRAWRDILDVFVQAGRGLVAAHAAQLVHRDFKPDNVLVDRSGRARVTDFGLARVDSSLDSDGPPPIDTHDSLTQTLTRTGSVMGTPGYMSPEQHFGKPADGRSDQYAFCVSLFEAVYGVRPFAGKTLREVAHAKWTNTIRDPRELGRRPGGIPKTLELAIRRGLDSEPDRRWPSMAALVDELEAIRRKPRTGLRIAAFALGGLVLGAWTWQAWPRPCVPGRERLAGVWDDDRVRQLGDAFASADTPAAEEAWTKTRDELQQHADRWAAAYDDVCGTSSRDAQARDAGMLCLQRRRTELRAAVDALSEGDRTTVHRASAVVEGLAPIEPCLHAEAEQPATPDDPQLVGRVEAVRERLAESAARREAGQYPAAHELARDAAEEADDIAFAPLRIEAHLALGLVLARSGSYDEAHLQMVDAFHGAREHGLDALALDAAIHLVFLVGVEQDHLGDALEWVRHGTAMLERLGDDDPFRRARLLENTSLLYVELERWDEAESGYREALLIRQEHGGGERGLAMLHNNYGNMLASRRRYAEAIAEHELALQARIARLGTDHPDVAMSLANIARIHLEQYRYDEGLARLAEAETIIAATIGEEHSMMATVLNMRGIAFLRTDRPREGRAMFERALAIRTRLLGPDHPTVGETWNAIAASYVSESDLPAAEQAFLHARAIFEMQGPQRRHSLLRVRSNLGAVAARGGRYAEAEEILSETIGQLEAILGADNPEMLASLQPRAIALLGLGRTREAMPYIERALALQRMIDEDEGAIEFLEFLRLWANYDLGIERERSVAEIRRIADELRTEHHAIGDLRVVEAWLAKH